MKKTKFFTKIKGVKTAKNSKRYCHYCGVLFHPFDKRRIACYDCKPYGKENKKDYLNQRS